MDNNNRRIEEGILEHERLRMDVRALEDRIQILQATLHGLQQNDITNPPMIPLLQRDNNPENPPLNNSINGNQGINEIIRNYLNRRGRYRGQNPTDGA